MSSSYLTFLPVGSELGDRNVLATGPVLATTLVEQYSTVQYSTVQYSTCKGPAWEEGAHLDDGGVLVEEGKGSTSSLSVKEGEGGACVVKRLAGIQANCIGVAVNVSQQSTVKC